MSVNDVIMDALKANNVGFVTTVPCKQLAGVIEKIDQSKDCLLYTSPSPRDKTVSRMPSSVRSRSITLSLIHI